PTVAFGFMIPLESIYRPDANNQLIYLGVDVGAQRISKLISFKSLSRPERNLLIYTLVTTFAHFLKGAHQMFWFLTMDDAHLFDLATNVYPIVNSLTTFFPPVFLLATSKLVRDEITLGWCGRSR
ncbi:hypothetical protein PENTCL1PPCAC_27270, partial [Pristionchus entomophagus]